MPLVLIYVSLKAEVTVDDTIKHLGQDKIEDLPLSPPYVGSMQIDRSNGSCHNSPMCEDFRWNSIILAKHFYLAENNGALVKYFYWFGPKKKKTTQPI